MKKILIFHNIPAPYRLSLFRKLSEIYDLTVVFLQRREKGRLWKIDHQYLNFPHVFLNELSFSLFKKNLTVNHGISSLIKKISPDVVIGPDNPPNFLAMLKVTRVCRKRRIPFLLWTGNFPGYKLGDNFILKIGDKIIDWIRRFKLYPNAKSFMAYGREGSLYLNSTYKINRDKIFVGTQGYPYEDLIPANFQYKEEERKFVYNNNNIIYIGYLQSRKGIQTLLKAAYSLKKERIKFKIQIIGEGETNIKKMIDEYSKKINVIYLGYKEGRDKYTFLKKAKILVLPTYKDPWGWVINEAMYLGVPVITTDKAMAKEMVIDGENGYVVKAGDVNALSRSIKRLFSLDENDYLNFSKKAYTSSMQYGVGYAVNCFRESIENIF